MVSWQTLFLSTVVMINPLVGFPVLAPIRWPITLH